MRSILTIYLVPAVNSRAVLNTRILPVYRSCLTVILRRHLVVPRQLPGEHEPLSVVFGRFPVLVLSAQMDYFHNFVYKDNDLIVQTLGYVCKLSNSCNGVNYFDLFAGQG